MNTLADAESAYRRRLTRVGQAVALGTVVAAAGSAATSVFGTTGAAAVHVVPLLAWATASGIAGALLAAVAPRPAVLALLLSLDLISATAAVSTSGGVAGPFWLLFVPVVLFSAVAIPSVTVSVATGATASAGVVVATVFAHVSLAANAGRLLVVLPVLPAVALLASLLVDDARRAGRAAAAESAALADEVRTMTVALARVAEGDLSEQPPVMSGPAQALAGVLGDTVTALRALVRTAQTGAAEVAAAAGQVLATAQEHELAAAAQSSAVAETSSTIEELAATAAQIAETAGSVAAYAAETLAQAEEGRAAVAASVAAMDAIETRVAAIAAAAGELGERGGQIGRIVEVIDDLADQTNLLALNAAIEAARAGDAGRGFAVVAAEVRRLAERAGEQVGRIAGLVAEIQAGTTAAVVASEQGAGEVRAGAERARAVVAALGRIRAMVDETTSAAQEISLATAQQRSASEQVVAAMGQVAEVSRQYAQGSRQAAAAAGQLNALAGELRAATAKFVVTAQ
jgi:methyl-accepting chemotaxis protein